MAKAPLDLKETVVMTTQEGAEIAFSVVALLEDEQTKHTYAVLMHRPEDPNVDESFVVTDPYGNLLQDTELAQQVLDDYLIFNEEANAGDGEQEEPE
jgi:uncharacterized protein YrzB (UPF0473 family)